MKYLRFSLRFLSFSLALAIIFINYRLYNRVQIVENEQGRVNIEVVKQLHFIQHELENGMAEQQQELFPEGLIFAHTNYALAWIDVLKTVKKDSDLYKNGKAEILKSLQILNENSTKSIFSANLQPENGVFYNGWKAYIQGKYLELEHKDTAVLNDFRTTCTSIADAFERISFHCIGNHSFLESYEKQIWVADNIVAIAALKRYAVLENDEKIKYRVQYWVEELEKIYENKLISHTVDAGMGFEVEGARGCSQSLILCFLPELDSAFSKKNYEMYCKNYKDSHFGLPFFREYAKNMPQGEGDIDSGPVIWNVGAVASLMAQKAAKLNGDYITANALRNESECFGFTYTNSTDKFYLGGQIPIADCFLAWCNADNAAHETALNQTFFWRLPFQFCSLFLLLLCFMVWKYAEIYKKIVSL